MLSKSHKIRSGVVLAAFLVCFSGIIAKLFSIQVIQHDYFVARGKRIYETREIIYPKRGSILDRNLKVVALSEPSNIICADLRHIRNLALTKNPSLLASRLAPLLNLDRERLLRTFALQGREAVYLKRKPTQEMIDGVEGLRRERSLFEEVVQNPPQRNPGQDDFIYRGIFLDNRVRRVYPDGTLLCHVLGFVADEPKPGFGLVRDDSYPVLGIEKSADKWLRGELGWRMKDIDNRRRWVISARTLEKPAVNGNNVVLTIDEGIQFICEEEIKRQFDEVSCKIISAVVVRPQTGEILAMANYPSFDPNGLMEFDPQTISNHTIEFSFEPGSAFKAVTGSLALEAGVVTPEEKVQCEHGAWKAPKGPVLHDAHGYGELTFEEVIVKSSNIGVGKVCARLGVETLHRGLKSFGLGSQTGIMLPGEIPGTLRPPEQWTGYSMAEVPMGQEVAVTPLQLAMAMAAIANGGVLMKPQIIKEIRDESGKVMEQFEPQVVRQVISESTAETMKSFLQKVVSKEGTGRRADIPGYSQGGKTGTAQKALPVRNETGEIVKWVYSDTVFNSTFCGFAPVDNPQVAILITLQGTVKPHHFGGTVAGPAFSRIGERVLKYLQVEPDEKEELKTSAQLP
jgi:cell division protein FtsI/penicillin-binding protein 2